MKLYILTFLVLFPALLISGEEALYPQKKIEKNIRKLINNQSAEIQNQWVGQSTPERKHTVDLYQISTGNGTNYFAAVTQAKGRYDLFDYLLVVNSKMEVVNVKILKYRSEHGGEIASPKWLQQFVGFSGGELRYQTDISAISGATLSARSITQDIPKVLEIIRKTAASQNP